MLVYYGIIGAIPTASIPGEDPIGALALVCTAVSFLILLTASLPLICISTD